MDIKMMSNFFNDVPLGAAVSVHGPDSSGGRSKIFQYVYIDISWKPVYISSVSHAIVGLWYRCLNTFLMFACLFPFLY